MATAKRKPAKAPAPAKVKGSTNRERRIGDSDEVMSIAYVGDALAVGGLDSIELYRGGGVVSTIKLSTTGGVHSILATPTCVFTHEEKRVISVDIAKPKAKQRLASVSGETVSTLSISPDGGLLAAASSHGGGAYVKVFAPGEKRARTTFGADKAEWLDEDTLACALGTSKTTVVYTRSPDDDDAERMYGSVPGRYRDLAVKDGAVYVATTTGLARVALNKERIMTKAADFAWVWKDAEVWQIAVDGPTLVIATAKGVFALDDKGKARPLAKRAAIGVATSAGRVAYISHDRTPEGYTLTQAYELAL